MDYWSRDPYERAVVFIALFNLSVQAVREAEFVHELAASKHPVVHPPGNPWQMLEPTHPVPPDLLDLLELPGHLRVFGNTANVDITAPPGSITITVEGPTANISLAAPAGWALVGGEVVAGPADDSATASS